MTEKQWDILSGYIRALADELGLKDWTVFLSEEPTAPGVGAEMETTYGRKHVTIRVSKDFLSEDLETQRQTIIHELLHVHINPIEHVISFDLYNTFAVGTQTLDMMKSVSSRAVELAVDGIADAIAGFYKVIDWEAE